MDNRRSDPRRRVLKAAQIVFNHGGSVIDCTVRDISARGARLLLPSSLGVPAKFDLVLSTGEQYPAWVVWRTETTLGVSFSTSPPERSRGG